MKSLPQNSATHFVAPAQCRDEIELRMRKGGYEKRLAWILTEWNILCRFRTIFIPLRPPLVGARFLRQSRCTTFMSTEVSLG